MFFSNVLTLLTTLFGRQRCQSFKLCCAFQTLEYASSRLFEEQQRLEEINLESEKQEMEMRYRVLAELSDTYKQLEEELVNISRAIPDLRGLAHEKIHETLSWNM